MPPVLLINPNTIRPLVAPIGLDYLACGLKARGFEPELLDLSFADDEDEAIRRAVTGRDWAAIGITFRNLDDSYMAGRAFFAPRLKEIVSAVKALTEVPVVVGGVGFSVMPEAVLAACGADFGIWGDGEDSFADLLMHLEGKRSIEDVSNLVMRVGTNVMRNEAGFVDLAALPYERRDLVDNRRYFEAGGQGSIETKRGCYGGCIYCVDPVAKGRNERLKPPAKVVAETKSLLGQGVTCVHLCDSEFNLPPWHAVQVCEALIDGGLPRDMSWYTYASPMGFSEDLARLMRAAGCAGVNFGADSGSDEMLLRLRKGFRAEQLRDVVGACRKAGLAVMLDLMLGAPGETRKTLAQTVALMKEIDPDRVGISAGVRVYPGTALAEQLFREGAILVGAAGTVGGGDHDLLAPAFYVSPGIDEDIGDVLEELIGDDDRFFFANPKNAGRNYNYNENMVLVEAIADGHRGAYWDILRRVEERKNQEQGRSAGIEES